MKFFNQIADSKIYKALMPILYGWGAALVILGALFKILALDGANAMLMAGMGTEAFIFFMSAFEKAPKEYHWEKAYPQILEKPEETRGAVQQLNDIFKEAQIDSKVLAKLGDGMKKLSTSASQMGDVMDGTKKYNKQMTAASNHLEKINDLYVDQIKSFNTRMKVTEKMTDNLTASLEHSSKLSVEISNLSNNLNALNGVYGNILTAMTNKTKK
jgi:gliding motility-associated protein GldL